MIPFERIQGIENPAPDLTNSDRVDLISKSLEQLAKELGKDCLYEVRFTSDEPYFYIHDEEGSIILKARYYPLPPAIDIKK